MSIVVAEHWGDPAYHFRGRTPFSKDLEEDTIHALRVLLFPPRAACFSWAAWMNGFPRLGFRRHIQLRVLGSQGTHANSFSRVLSLLTSGYDHITLSTTWGMIRSRRMLEF